MTKEHVAKDKLTVRRRKQKEADAITGSFCHQLRNRNRHIDALAIHAREISLQEIVALLVAAIDLKKARVVLDLAWGDGMGQLLGEHAGEVHQVGAGVDRDRCLLIESKVTGRCLVLELEAERMNRPSGRAGAMGRDEG